MLLRDGYFCLRASNGKPIDPDAAFKEFFREKGKGRIAKRVEHFQERMGVAATAVRILDLKGRWASCSKDGSLNFHWKCVMAPTNVLDYVIVHELLHLWERNHSTRFWALVARHVPGYQDAKRWLRTYGPALSV